MPVADVEGFVAGNALCPTGAERFAAAVAAAVFNVVAIVVAVVAVVSEVLQARVAVIQDIVIVHSLGVVPLHLLIKYKKIDKINRSISEPISQSYQPINQSIGHSVEQSVNRMMKIRA